MIDRPGTGTQSSVRLGKQGGMCMQGSFRRMMCLAWAAAVLSMIEPAITLAYRGEGGNCARCHAATKDRMNVTGNTGVLSVNLRLDGGVAGTGNTGMLKSFTVRQGQTVGLTINVINGGASGQSNAYAVTVTGTVKTISVTPPTAGVESLGASTIKGVRTSVNNILSFTPDPGWTMQAPERGKDAGKVYFTKGSFKWDGTANSQTFYLTVNPNAPPDVYSLTLRATGVDSNTGPWTQSEEVLLDVVTAMPDQPSGSWLLFPAGGGLACMVWQWRRRSRSAHSASGFDRRKRKPASVRTT